MNQTFKANYSHIIVLISLGVAVVWCFVLVSPYLEPILIALIFGLVFHPVQERFGGKLHHRPNLKALCSCVALTVVILLPAVFIGLAILRQGAIYSADLYQWASTGGLESMTSSAWFSQSVGRFKEWLPDDMLKPDVLKTGLLKTVAFVGQDAVGYSAKIASEVTGFFMSFALMLFVLFFVLRDYERMFAFMHHAIPLSRSQENLLISEIFSVSKSSLLGSFLTAICQGIAGGFALWLAGFPGLFWGTMMAFASLIPVVGTALIWLPAAIYLIVTGEWGWGLFVIVWGVLVVGSIDNFLRPLLMQGSSAMNTVMIFFSLLGGISSFGLMGLLYGPIIFTITLVLFRLYEQEFKDFLDYQDQN